MLWESAVKKDHLLEEATTADGKKISLWERDGEYAIRVDGVELMSTRHRYSEEKLGEWGVASISGNPRARVLIGGLGLGFTLKSALAHLPTDATVIVAELNPEIVAWNRNTAFPFASGALADSRVQLKLEDVAETIWEASPGFDAILLDVDNGPTALSARENGHLYESSGLAEIYRVLRPGGCLAVWSVDESPPFVKRLNQAGFASQVHRTHAHATSGGRRVIFLARKTAADN